MPGSQGTCAYSLELGELLAAGDVLRAADFEDLLPGELLPLWMHGEHHGGPCQEV